MIPINGGTAIALQIGHRRFIDFDSFFSDKPLDTLRITGIEEGKIEQYGKDIIDIIKTGGIYDRKLSIPWRNENT